MSLFALASYGDSSSDEGDCEPEAVATGKVPTLLKTKQVVRRLVPVVSGGRRSDGSKQPVRIAMPTLEQGQVSERRASQTIPHHQRTPPSFLDRHIGRIRRGGYASTQESEGIKVNLQTRHC